MCRRFFPLTIVILDLTAIWLLFFPDLRLKILLLDGSVWIMERM